MKKILHKTIEEFLSVFFSIFSAKIDSCKWEDNKIKGFLVWKDEDEKQEFSWVIPSDELDVAGIIAIINFSVKRELIIGDKIGITKDELVTKLGTQGWGEEKARKTIEQLCSIRISMVDDGNETDFFIVHF
jgi:hypothetical protein